MSPRVNRSAGGGQLSADGPYLVPIEHANMSGPLGGLNPAGPDYILHAVHGHPVAFGYLARAFKVGCHLHSTRYSTTARPVKG